MAQDLVAAARRRRCFAPCPHLRRDRALMDQRGDRWANYCAFAGPDPAGWLCITSDFLRGPETNCKAGLWAGVSSPEFRVSRDDAAAPAVAMSAKLETQNSKPASACVYAEAECRGCKNRPKVHCHKLEIVRPAAWCADCGERFPLSDLHIGAVITAWNEGDEVRATIESLRASVKEAQLTIILVDDGSTDGSCAAIRRSTFNVPSSMSKGEAVNVEHGTSNAVVVVRHDVPLGVGRSRNAGWRAARELGCHVVSFHDAHMRFPSPPDGGAGVLEKLAIMAMQRRCVVSSASRGIPSQGRLTGCWLHYSAHYYGIQPKWATSIPPGWQRTPCMMGAGYVLSTKTAHLLEASTGSLWEDTAGRWGFSEQALSIKAYLLGVPVLTNSALPLDHKYRDKNPTPGANVETWKNVARATAVLFGPQVYQERFADWCQENVKPRDLAPILAEAFERWPGAPGRRSLGEGGWPVDPDTVWTHLLGEGAPITSPHPDHAWLPEVEQACSQMPLGARVFIWRPGEAAVLVRKRLPDAKISAVEIGGHRAQTWKHLCRRLGIELSLGKLNSRTGRSGDYAVPPVKDCDLILVNGEMQEECKAAAQLALKPAGPSGPGGKLLVNPSADRRQLDADERRKEKDQVAAALVQPAGSEPARPAVPTSAAAPLAGVVGVAQAPSPAAVVTVCLLNWKRPQNIGPILDSIAAQTVRCQVYLWNNAPTLHWAQGGPGDIINLSVGSPNLGCFPRWWLASRAQTEWVCSLDDDLCFAATDALDIALRQAQGHDGIVGAFGVQLVDGTPYKRALHFNLPAEDTPVDIVKGRFMLLRRSLLDRVPLHIPSLDFAPGLGDDIVLSLTIGAGRTLPHVLVGGLKGKFRELPAKGALEAQAGHYERRQRTVEAVRAWVNGKASTTDLPAGRVAGRTEGTLL